MVKLFSSWNQLMAITLNIKRFLESVNRPLIGLNWPSNVNTNTSFNDFVECFVDSAQDIVGNNNFDLIATHSMIPIVSEMFKNNLIRKAIIIVTKTDLNSKTFLLNQSNENIINYSENIFNIIVEYITRNAPKFIKQIIERELHKINDIKVKISKFSDILQYILDKTTKEINMEIIINLIFNRMFIVNSENKKTELEINKSSRLMIAYLNGDQQDCANGMVEIENFNIEVYFNR